MHECSIHFQFDNRFPIWLVIPSYLRNLQMNYMQCRYSIHLAPIRIVLQQQQLTLKLPHAQLRAHGHSSHLHGLAILHVFFTPNLAFPKAIWASLMEHKHSQAPAACLHTTRVIIPSLITPLTASSTTDTPSRRPGLSSPKTSHQLFNCFASIRLAYIHSLSA